MKRKFVGETTAYLFSETKEVFLVYIDKPVTEKKILKKLQNKGEQHKIVVSQALEMSLKFGEIGNILVKSKLFPDNSWYKVMNLSSSYNIYQILSESSNIVKGEVMGTTFECSFETPDECYLVSREMKDWEIGIEEMRRSFSVSLGKKTKKLVPGYRYDTEEKSLIYLGKFCSRREDKNSKFSTLVTPTDYVYLFTDWEDWIEKNFTSVSEVIMNGYLKKESDDLELGIVPIEISYKSRSLVEVGKVLEPGPTDENFSRYYGKILENTSKVRKWVISDDGGPFEDYGKFIFDVLSINKNLSDYDSYFEVINQYLYLVIEYVLERYETTNKEEIKKFIYQLIYYHDSNNYKEDYYSQLFKIIDIDRYIDQAVSVWSPGLRNVDFEVFSRTGFKSKIIRCNLRTEASYKDPGLVNIVNIGKSIGSKEIARVVVNIINLIKTGEKDVNGVSSFKTNIGTARNPLVYYNISISTAAILDNAGDLDLNTVKRGLMESDIRKVLIQYDCNSVIE